MKFRQFALVATLVMIAAAPSAARAQERYAALVVNPDTREVLHSRFAEQSRRPASLTKLMTLYLAFEDIRAGEAGLGDRLRISADAAAQPPVGLGLEEGDSIRMLDALKALIVRSANDAAVVIAERLARDEEAFARRMTLKARELGMVRTRFSNASGLPAPAQFTTARDMATLATALYTDFPEYYALFDVRRMEWGGRTIATHNAVLTLVDGADGLKTGYTDASGYNIVASAARGPDRLIAVVLGGPSAQVRDAHAALLLERGFEELRLRRERGELIAVADTIQSPRLSPSHAPGQSSGDVDDPRARRLRIILEADDNDDRAELTPAAQTIGPPEDVDSAPLPPVDPAAPPDETALAQGVNEGVSAARTSGRSSGPGWRIQVGAFQEAARAEARLDALLAIAAEGRPGPAPIRIVTPAADLIPTLYRAQLGGYPDRDAARAACERITESGAACFVVGP